jgi:hypothetical protein
LDENGTSWHGGEGAWLLWEADKPRGYFWRWCDLLRGSQESRALGEFLKELGLEDASFFLGKFRGSVRVGECAEEVWVSKVERLRLDVDGFPLRLASFSLMVAVVIWRE